MDACGQDKILENEPAIVEKAKKDDQAFEVLYNFYFPKIYGYLFKRVGSHEATEDLVSTIFMKVFINIRGYKHCGYTFGAWVYKIATNELIDYYRKQSKVIKVSIEKAEELESNKISPSQEADNYLNRQIIMKVLGKLSKKHQKVICLKFFAEKTGIEIAEILKISENNVRVLLHRALKNFSNIYKNYAK